MDNQAGGILNGAAENYTIDLGNAIKAFAHIGPVAWSSLKLQPHSARERRNNAYGTGTSYNSILNHSITVSQVFSAISRLICRLLTPEASLPAKRRSRATRLVVDVTV